MGKPGPGARRKFTARLEVDQEARGLETDQLLEVEVHQLLEVQVDGRSGETNRTRYWVPTARSSPPPGARARAQDPATWSSGPHPHPPIYAGPQMGRIGGSRASRSSAGPGPRSSGRARSPRSTSTSSWAITGGIEIGVNSAGRGPYGPTPLTLPLILLDEGRCVSTFRVRGGRTRVFWSYLGRAV